MPAPGEQISIDEAMILGHMRCPIRVSMPAKPINRGTLLYCDVCHHHHNVKMNRINECDRGDGFARIKPVKCFHCIKQKHTNDKRSTDCCLECKIPLHKECHADYHNFHHSNDV